MPISLRRRCRLLSKDTLAESPSESGHSDSIKVVVFVRTPPLAISALSKSSGRFCTLRLKTIGCPSRSRVNCPSVWIFSGHARCPSCSGGFGLQACDAERHHRAGEAVEVDLLGRLSVHHPFDQLVHGPADQDLAGLGFGAEAGGEIGHPADDAIADAGLVADGADGGVAMRDADAERDVVAALAPGRHQLREALLHLQRHARRVRRRVLDDDRIVEDHQHRARR